MVETERAKVWEVESALGRASGAAGSCPFALAFLSYYGESRSLCGYQGCPQHRACDG